MTVKDIIEKLEGDLEGKNPNIVYIFDQPDRYIGNLLKWIKSNLEEEQEVVEIMKDYKGWSFCADTELHPHENRIILQNICARNYEKLKCPLKIEDIEGNSSQEVRKKLEKAIDIFELNLTDAFLDTLREET